MITRLYTSADATKWHIHPFTGALAILLKHKVNVPLAILSKTEGV